MREPLTRTRWKRCLPQTAKLVLALVAGIVIGGWGIAPARAQPAGHPAYVVAEMHVTDPAGFTELMRRLPATLAPYHGRAVARGLPDVRQGAPPDGDVFIFAFDSVQDANRWCNSLGALLQKSATARVYIVDGLAR